MYKKIALCIMTASAIHAMEPMHGHAINAQRPEKRDLDIYLQAGAVAVYIGTMVAMTQRNTSDEKTDYANYLAIGCGGVAATALAIKACKNGQCTIL